MSKTDVIDALVVCVSTMNRALYTCKEREEKLKDQVATLQDQMNRLKVVPVPDPKPATYSLSDFGDQMLAALRALTNSATLYWSETSKHFEEDEVKYEGPDEIEDNYYIPDQLKDCWRELEGAIEVAGSIIWRADGSKGPPLVGETNPCVEMLPHVNRRALDWEFSPDPKTVEALREERSPEELCGALLSMLYELDDARKKYCTSGTAVQIGRMGDLVRYIALYATTLRSLCLSENEKPGAPPRTNLFFELRQEITDGKEKYNKLREASRELLRTSGQFETKVVDHFVGDNDCDDDKEDTFLPDALKPAHAALVGARETVSYLVKKKKTRR